VVGGAQEQAALAGEHERAVGRARERVEMKIFFAGTECRPRLAAVVGGETLPEGADDERGLRVEREHGEKRSADVVGGALRGPGGAAVGGVQDGGVVAYDPAVRGVRRERDSRQHGGGRRGHALPGLALVGGAEHGAALADGDEGRLRAAGDEGRIDQERARGGIALREQPERAEQEPQTREKDAEFHGKTRGQVNRVWPG